MSSELLRNSSKNPFLIAVLINAAILVCFVAAFGLRLEIHDDLAIAVLIQDQYLYIRFVNYILCAIASGFQSLISFANGWVLLQIVLSFISFCTLSYVWIKSCPRIINFVFAILFPILFAYDHYCEIQFTKTSALLLIAGIVAIICYFKSRETREPGLFTIGLVLLVFGSWYRFQNIYPVLGLSAVWFIFEIVKRPKVEWIQYLKNNLKPIIVLFVILIAIYGTYDLSNRINVSTPELLAHKEYHSARAAVIDYGGLAWDNPKNQLLFEQLGLSHNDIRFISSSYFVSDDLLDIESLRTIAENNAAMAEGSGDTFIEMIKSLLRSVKYNELRGAHLVFAFLLMILLLSFTTKRWRFFSIVLCLFALLGYFYLFNTGRPIYRATYVIDIVVIAFLLLPLSPEYLKAPFKVFQRTVIVALSVLIAFMTILGAHRQLQLYPHPSGEQDANVLYEYMEANKNNFFIIAPGTRYQFLETWSFYRHPLKPMPPDIFGNGYELSTWQTLSPFDIQKLSNFGLENIYLDSIDNERVFLIDNGNMEIREEFFNKHYAEDGSVIAYVLYDFIGGFSVWQTKTID